MTMLKNDQIEKIIQQSENNQQNNQSIKQQQLQKNHLIRSILIVIDITDSMAMKDIKPSRLTVTTQNIKYFIKRVKDQTPIVQIALATAQQQLCQIKVDFTHNQKLLEENLDKLVVSRSQAKISFQNVLRTTLKVMEQVPLYYQRQLLYIQSYPATKDNRNIRQTMRNFIQSGTKINLISFSAKNHIFQDLVQNCQGMYQTVSCQESFKILVQKISKLSPYNLLQSKPSLIKMSLVKKQSSQIAIQCFCHMKHKRNYFICGVCCAVLCTQPPTQCIICGTLLILPVDLFRHRSIE